jgi:speckle-type POZ protein
LLKGIGDGEPIASDRFAVGGHEWVLLFYPDGKRSTSDPNAPSPADDPYAALFVALIGEGPRPQGVVTSVNGRVVRAFHRFTLVDQSDGGRHITKGRQRDQGAVKISCARQDPNARNCHGYRKFVRRSVLESPNNGYLKDDTIVIRYEIELVVTSGGALNRPKQLAPAIDVGAFPTLGDQIRTLLTEDADKTDVVFEVEGERFPAHSLVVAARSSAFRAMLRTGAEMREGSEGIIRIGDVRAPVFRALLQFLYSDELPDGTGRNTSAEFASRRADGDDEAQYAYALAKSEASARRRAFANRGGSGGASSSSPFGVPADAPELDIAMTQHLLVAADRFDLTRLRAMCEAKLCDTVEVETAATTLALAEQNHALALKQACLQFVASHLGEVMLTEGYKHMEESCPNLASELLKTVAQQNQAAAAAAVANAALPAPAPAPPGPGPAPAAPALPPAAAAAAAADLTAMHRRGDAPTHQANVAVARLMDDALAAAAAAGAAAATTIAAIPATGQAAVAAAVNPNPDPSRGGDVAATRELSPRAPRQARAGPGPVGEASRLAEAAQLGEPTRRPGFGHVAHRPAVGRRPRARTRGSSSRGGASAGLALRRGRQRASAHGLGPGRRRGGGPAGRADGTRAQRVARREAPHAPIAMGRAAGRGDDRRRRRRRRRHRRRRHRGRRGGRRARRRRSPVDARRGGGVAQRRRRRQRDHGATRAAANGGRLVNFLSTFARTYILDAGRDETMICTVVTSLRNTTRVVDVTTDAFESARRLVLPSRGARDQIADDIANDHALVFSTDDVDACGERNSREM